jgi:hypothetical protein
LKGLVLVLLVSCTPSKQRWTKKMVVLLETKMVKVTQVNFSIKYL